jgi:hypothetical protein
MITLKTLENATAQEIFEQATKHLLSQKVRSMSTDGMDCMYKQENLACAAGCFISDDEYSPEMERMGWIELSEKNIVPSAHAGLIQHLQNVHDSAEAEEWKETLIKFAIKHKLNYSFI